MGRFWLIGDWFLSQTRGIYMPMSGGCLNMNGILDRGYIWMLF